MGAVNSWFSSSPDMTQKVVKAAKYECRADGLLGFLALAFFNCRHSFILCRTDSSKLYRLETNLIFWSDLSRRECITKSNWRLAQIYEQEQLDQQRPKAALKAKPQSGRDVTLEELFNFFCENENGGMAGVDEFLQSNMHVTHRKIMPVLGWLEEFEFPILIARFVVFVIAMFSAVIFWKELVALCLLFFIFMVGASQKIKAAGVILIVAFYLVSKFALDNFEKETYFMKN